MNPFARLLEEQGYIVLDGGLATALELEGHDLRDALWSARLLLDDPGAIRAVHAAYLDAGADCLITSAYQATVAGFERRGATRAEATAALRRSTEVALEAVRTHGAAHAALVAASIGPYGAWLADGSEYHGRYGIGVAELVDFHRERFLLLAGSGADLLACETIPSAPEAEALVRLLDDVPDTWAFLSFTCRDDGSLRDGSSIESVVDLCSGHPRVVAVGVNCTEPWWIGGLVSRIRSRTELPVVIYPNSGELYDGRTRTWAGSSTGGTTWMQGLEEGWEAGARIVGGCCRTGPEEIRELRARLASGDFPR